MPETPKEKKLDLPIALAADQAVDVVLVVGLVGDHVCEAHQTFQQFFVILPGERSDKKGRR